MVSRHYGLYCTISGIIFVLLFSMKRSVPSSTMALGSRSLLRRRPEQKTAHGLDWNCGINRCDFLLPTLTRDLFQPLCDLSVGNRSLFCNILVFALAYNNQPLRLLFGNRLSVYFGDISYSMYLLHFLIVTYVDELGLSTLKPIPRLWVYTCIVLLAPWPPIT